MTIKVGFVGGPNAGKSTTAMAITAALNAEGYRAYYVDEFSRQFMTRHKRLPTTIMEQVYLTKNQLKKEQEAQTVIPDYMICDSPVFLAIVYAMMLVESDDFCSGSTSVLAEIYTMVAPTLHSYDYIFFLKNVKPKVHSVLGEYKELDALECKIRGFLALHSVKHIDVQEKKQDLRTKEVFGHLLRGSLKDKALV